jgi:archaeosine-15-forming tRNA-guanine transglycosylase
LVFRKILETRDASKVIVEETPIQGEPVAVVNEADALLAVFEARELAEALSKRIK